MERADRLRDALKRAGGAATVARQIGMPIATLNNYVAGRDMKASALVRLAQGCEVSIEWLAAGTGPMRPSDQAESQISGFSAELLAAKAHFWALFTLIRSCQEWYQHARIAPTLKEVFDWIGSHYETAQRLPDAPVDLKPADPVPGAPL